MKDAEKLDNIRKQIEVVRPHLRETGDAALAVRGCLTLLVDYIEFMVTPSEDDE